MAMKELLYRLQPAQVYIVLTVSIAYFLIQLYLSHISHALTLLVNSYHMLCNIVTLSGCIITIKQCNDNNSRNESGDSKSDGSTKTKGNFQSIFSKTSDNNKFIEVNEAELNRHERSLRNTFGWMRIEILTMLIGCIFLGAFCFSLLVEAVQTLIHISHQDTMHYAIAVFIVGIGGLVLNGFCYFLIGGYTYHQSSFLHLTSTGDVVVEQVASRDGLYHGSRNLTKAKRIENNQSIAVITSSSIQLDVQPKTTDQTNPSHHQSQRKHTLNEIFRDICSTIFVLICSLIVHFANNENVTKYVDPIISIISGITLLVLSYPYIKESCLILLQTIPASIDIEVFKADLLKTFDDIVSVHDLHIWQMTSEKYVSTVHILFHDPIVYVNIKDEVVNFFHAQGITIVTIQPEFRTKSSKDSKDMSLVQCLIGCQSPECVPKTCCSTTDLDTILVDGDKNMRRKAKKSKTYHRKSNSMLSLNVTSLVKLRKLTGSTQDIMKKSVSESHVIQLGSDDSLDSQNTSTSPSNARSSANNLCAMHNSISELQEIDFHNGCDERTEQRLQGLDENPPIRPIESISEHEDSTLLDKSNGYCKPTQSNESSAANDDDATQFSQNKS